jgi:hypothetical protein
MRSVPARLRRAVIERAKGRCEYCGLSQDGQAATFHIDHVTPIVDGDETARQNLALACVSCSLRKGARRTAEDPLTGQIVPLFSPRRDEWHSHFHWDGVYLVGLTVTGRATIAALADEPPGGLGDQAGRKGHGTTPPHLKIQLDHPLLDCGKQGS